MSRMLMFSAGLLWSVTVAGVCARADGLKAQFDAWTLTCAKAEDVKATDCVVSQSVDGENGDWVDVMLAPSGSKDLSLRVMRPLGYGTEDFISVGTEKRRFFSRAATCYTKDGCLMEAKLSKEQYEVLRKSNRLIVTYRTSPDAGAQFALPTKGLEAAFAELTSKQSSIEPWFPDEWSAVASKGVTLQFPVGSSESSGWPNSASEGFVSRVRLEQFPRSTDLSTSSIGHR